MGILRSVFSYIKNDLNDINSLTDQKRIENIDESNEIVELSERKLSKERGLSSNNVLDRNKNTYNRNQNQYTNLDDYAHVVERRER